MIYIDNCEQKVEQKDLKNMQFVEERNTLKRMDKESVL
jgi:hypothetical protein